MAGPRQTGKTTIACQVAEAFSFPVHFATADEPLFASPCRHSEAGALGIAGHFQNFHRLRDVFEGSPPQDLEMQMGDFLQRGLGLFYRCTGGMIRMGYSENLSSLGIAAEAGGQVYGMAQGRVFHSLGSSHIGYHRFSRGNSDPQTRGGLSRKGSLLHPAKLMIQIIPT
jgi:hypothetical protein